MSAPLVAPPLTAEAAQISSTGWAGYSLRYLPAEEQISSTGWAGYPLRYLPAEARYPLRYLPSETAQVLLLYCYTTVILLYYSHIRAAIQLYD